MSEYLLYGFAQSGNCYKPALYLELAGADWNARFVDYFNGETRTPEYRKINVMGEAPVLEHGDLRLSQSGVILDYLLERFGRYGWSDNAERRETLRWLLWDNHKLTGYTATYRFLRALAPRVGNAPDKAVTEEFGKRAQAAWQVLDAQLSARRYLVGERLTIADLSACAYLFFEDELGVDWNLYPGIRDWLARIRAEPRWKHPYELLPGHPIPDRKQAPR
jgi:glutathione S-transferase